MREDWIEVELGDVCNVVSGKNQKNVENPNGKYPIYGSGGIFGYADDYLCESGTTIIGRKWTINSPIYVNQKFWNVDTAFGMSPSNNIDSKYIHYLCVGFDFKKLDKSTTIPSLAKRDIVKIKFPIAPLPEQRAIAAKIEQLFSELDNGIANLKAAKSKLEIYCQAILKQAFEGKLTKDWRKKQPKNHGNHVNPKNHSTDNLPETWKQVKVGDICDCVVPNRDKPKSFNGNIFWITTPDLNEDSIHINYSLIDKGLTKDEVIEYKDKVIPINSVIMTCVGKFGITALIEKESVINQQLHAFLPNENVFTKYLAYALKTQKDYMYRVSTAITISYLNKNNCNSVPINLPPNIEEQIQIVQEIETRLSVCDKLNESIDQSLEKAQALRQSILKKTFEGKLLSQDELQNCRQQPDWEPAAKLLERVKNKKSKWIATLKFIRAKTTKSS